VCIICGNPKKKKFYKKDKKTTNSCNLTQPVKYSSNTQFYSQARNRFFNLRKPIQDNKKWLQGQNSKPSIIEKNVFGR
jgi:hypothetical protein